MRIEHIYKERKKKKIIRLRKNLVGKELRKEIEGIEKRYSRIKRESPIFVLEDKMRKLKREVEITKRIKSISKIIDSTGYKREQKHIASCLKETQSSVYKTFMNAINSKQMQKVACPLGWSEDILYVDKVGDEFHIDNKIKEHDKYQQVFRTAFGNVRSEISLSNSKEETEENYVKDEMQELETVEQYWRSQDFQDYLKRIEEEDPKKFKDYKRAQVKKIEAIRQLKEIYQDVNQNRRNLDNIKKAIVNLEEAKAILPEKVYKKCKKSLLAQQKKEQKKENKILKQKNNVFSKTSLSQSINNAREYEQSIDRLKKITSQQVLEDMLKNMKGDLAKAEKALTEERAQNQFIVTNKDVVVKNGEIYETGDGVSGYNTNSTAIYEAETKVDKLKRAIIKQTEINRQLAEERNSLEGNINSIHGREVDDTIKGEKANPLALSEGRKQVDSRNNASFVEKVEIDYGKVQANLNNRNTEEQANLHKSTNDEQAFQEELE